MKKKLLLLFFLGFWLQSNAQNTVEVDSSFRLKGIIKLNPSVVFYIDSTEKVSFEKIKKTQFVEVNNYIDFAQKLKENSTIWLKFKLKNTSQSDTIKALFSAGNHFETTLYVLDNEQLTSQSTSSYFILENARPYRYNAQYLPIVLVPQTNRVFYAAIKGFSSKKIILLPAIVSYEWEAKTNEKALYDNRFAIAINYSTIAVLLFLGVFTLFQYFQNRQRYFLYYSLYLFSMAIFAIWGFVHSSYVVHLLSYSTFLLVVLQQNFYILLTQFCYFLFINEFLELGTNNPKIKKMLEFLLRSLVFLVFLELFFTLVINRLDLENYLTTFTQIYLSVFGVILLIYVYQIKSKLALYIKIGSTFLLLGGVFGFLSGWLQWVPQSSAILEHYPNVFFCTCVLLEILFFSMGLGYKSSEIIQQKNDLEQAFSLSELNTLRLQINPHFLFNSLNSIKSYIIKNKTDEAADYLTDFSTLIRSILQKSKEQVVSLQEELDTLLLYIKLERLRFQQKFDFVLEISPTIDTQEVMIPALLLQPYIENAIKHGLGNKADGGVLKLIISELEGIVTIVIDDNGIGRKRAAELKDNADGHQSMGLQINEDRLKLLKKMHGWNITCQIIDKYDDNQMPQGTQIIIQIPK